MSFCVWWCCSCDLVRALLLQYISNPVTECEGSMCCFYTKLLFHFCILALVYLNLCAARGEMQTPCYQCCCQSNVFCSGFPLGNKQSHCQLLLWKHLSQPLPNLVGLLTDVPDCKQGSLFDTSLTREE